MSAVKEIQTSTQVPQKQVAHTPTKASAVSASSVSTPSPTASDTPMPRKKSRSKEPKTKDKSGTFSGLFAKLSSIAAGPTDEKVMPRAKLKVYHEFLL